MPGRAKESELPYTNQSGGQALMRPFLLATKPSAPMLRLAYANT